MIVFIQNYKDDMKVVVSSHVCLEHVFSFALVALDFLQVLLSTPTVQTQSIYAEISS